MVCCFRKNGRGDRFCFRFSFGRNGEKTTRLCLTCNKGSKIGSENSSFGNGTPLPSADNAQCGGFITSVAFTMRQRWLA